MERGQQRTSEAFPRAISPPQPNMRPGVRTADDSPAHSRVRRWQSRQAVGAREAPLLQGRREGTEARMSSWTVGLPSTGGIAEACEKGMESSCSPSLCKLGPGRTRPFRGS
eukprot:357440-Chlamydomonas_euryale.AAC.3